MNMLLEKRRLCKWVNWIQSHRLFSYQDTKEARWQENTNKRKKKPKELRALTNRERARLQTFPDSYVFEGTKESVRKQIGMAVPPQGAKIIFEAILRTFAGIEYESMPANIKE